MIALVDYGLGNIHAFANIYKRLGIDVWPAKTPSDLCRASKIILPGVGAFDWAMSRLQNSGLRDQLDEEVLIKKKPVLGVCVGMQMMAQSSEEGVLPGLCWIDAKVVKFDVSFLHDQTHLPHMGWNDVDTYGCNLLFRGIDTPRYYFLHSFYMKPQQEIFTIATAQYGISFAAAVRSDNVYGTQFHPEKSHQWGIVLLKNFAELA